MNVARDLSYYSNVAHFVVGNGDGQVLKHCPWWTKGGKTRLAESLAKTNKVKYIFSDPKMLNCPDLGTY